MSAPEPIPLVLYGASGHANAVKSHMEQGGFARIVAFIDDFRGDQGLSLDGRPIISFALWRERYRDVPCFIAVGDTAAKRTLADRVAAAGGRFCRFHDRPDRSFPESTVGAGSFVQLPGYLGPNSRVGDHVTIMAMSSVGHDVEIGDCCTICPSCTIGGHVVIESEVFLGSGSVVVNGRPGKPLLLGKGAVIAAGAVVMKSVPAGATMIGNPARPLRKLAHARRRRGE